MGLSFLFDTTFMGKDRVDKACTMGPVSSIFPISVAIISLCFGNIQRGLWNIGLVYINSQLCEVPYKNCLHAYIINTNGKYVSTERQFPNTSKAMTIEIMQLWASKKSRGSALFTLWCFIKWLLVRGHHYDQHLLSVWFIVARPPSGTWFRCKVFISGALVLIAYKFGFRSWANLNGLFTNI